MVAMYFHAPLHYHLVHLLFVMYCQFFAEFIYKKDVTQESTKGCTTLGNTLS